MNDSQPECRTAASAARTSDPATTQRPAGRGRCGALSVGSPPVCGPYHTRLPVCVPPLPTRGAVRRRPTWRASFDLSSANCLTRRITSRLTRVPPRLRSAPPAVRAQSAVVPGSAAERRETVARRRTRLHRPADRPPPGSGTAGQSAAAAPGYRERHTAGR